MTTKIKDKRDGFVMPAVIIVIIFTVMMGLTLLEIGTLENIASRRRTHREKAFYLAEAGAEYALAHILNGEQDWKGAERTLGEGTFLVERVDTGAWVRVNSTGSFSGTEETVRVTLRHVHIWSEGVFASDGVYLGSSANIASYDSSTDDFFPHGEEGHTGSLIKIDFAANAEGIQGNAFVAEGGEVIDENYVLGETINDAVFPESLTNMVDVVIPSELTERVYTVGDDLERTEYDDAENYSLDDDGNLDIKGNTTVELAPGDYKFKSISVGGSAKLVISDDTRLYVEDEVQMNGTPSWEMRGETRLYMGAGSTFTASGDTKLYHILTENEDADDENLQSSDPTGFQIFSASNRNDAIELYNSPDKDGIVGFVGLIYAPRGVVDLANNTDFYGGITARELIVGNNSNLYYDINLIQTGLDGMPGKLQIANWSKSDWESSQEF